MSPRTTLRWKGALAEAPTWALEKELAARRSESAPPAQYRTVVVDPESCRVDWRGQTYRVPRRAAEVLHAMVRAHAHGRQRVQPDTIARWVWPGYTKPSSDRSVRFYIHKIRRCVPGLVESTRDGTYWLADAG